MPEYSLVLPVANDDPEVLDTSEVSIDPFEITGINQLPDGILLIQVGSKRYRVYRQDLDFNAEATIDQWLDPM